MSKIKKLGKDDYEDLDYTADYSLEMAEVADVIATSTWIVPSDTSESVLIDSIELKDDVNVDYSVDDPSPKYRNNSSAAVTKTDDTTTVFISGGTLGETYRVMNRITTVAGRQYSRVFDLVIERQSEC